MSVLPENRARPKQRDRSATLCVMGRTVIIPAHTTVASGGGTQKQPSLA